MMTEVSDHPVANLLAVAWQARLEGIHAMLLYEPSGARAPLWKIQVRILSFLLSRYGSDPSIEWPRPPMFQSCDRLTFVVPLHGGKPPRSPDVIREVLRRIAEANLANRS